MKIQQLSKDTYQKIAAGEVIDRPVAVVRELLDNAIDSEASQIRLNIVEGGKSLIQITDNGFGMSSNDLKICYHKHTTSKIKNFDDIYQTISLGFRGEALNAISLVSEIEISSKTNDDLSGYSIQVRGGELVAEKEIARNTGTTVKVQHLFYNIPVRRKFLKSEISEFRQIKDHFIHKSIPFYDREFHLIHNEKTIFASLKSKSPVDRLKMYFTKDISSQLIEVQKDFGDFQIYGFLSQPNFFKGSKKFQLCYVNNRPIFSPAIASAITLGYKDICPVGQHPVAILFIQTSPIYVDVNIHPTKREVKLINESSIHQGIHHLIKETISQNISLPKIEFQDRVKHSLEEFYQKENYENQQGSFNYQKSIYDDSHRFSKAPSTKDNAISKQNQQPATEDYRIVGTLFKTYIVMEHENELIIVDQHAAHERLEYEKIKAKIGQNKGISSQNLLTAVTLDIPTSDIEAVGDKLSELSILGFEIDVFGENSVIVRAIPFFLKLEQAKRIAEKLLNSIIEEKKLPTTLDFIDEMLKMKACKTAIKSGDQQSETELSHLILELLNYPNPFACPHGRPTALRLSQSEIEQLFLRKK